MATTQRSSFQKAVVLKKGFIKGTSPSIHNSQLLISSGISSFDDVIGGGIPVGSLLLINEDEYGTYARLMLKYFLAEGIASEHAVFLCSEGINAEEMIQELPAVVDSQVEDTNKSEMENGKMTVAWRYENLKAVSSKESHKHFAHYFDLSKNMDDKIIKNSDIIISAPKKGTFQATFQESPYYSLLKEIQKNLEEGVYFGKQTNSERKILRICLLHLNSPFWQNDGNSESQKFLLKFLYSLRGLIRNAYASCCFTLPFSNYKRDLMDKCIHLADISIQLQSFIGTKFENLAAYKNYHGFFLIQKLASINSLIAYNPQASNFAFKLRRKKFVIEAFYLPPELDESTEREPDNQSILYRSKSKKLDF